MLLQFYTTYISEDIANYKIVHAKVGAVSLPKTKYFLSKTIRKTYKARSCIIQRITN